MFPSDPKSPLLRIVAFLLGSALVARGLASILRNGDLLHYQNWSGQLVFAPFVLVIGLVIIFGALFKPEILGRRERPKR
jgi:hypothetical protein